MFLVNGGISAPLSSSGIVLEEPKQKASVGAKFWQWSLLSHVPWVIRTRDKFQLPTTVNRKLKKHSRPRGNAESAAQYTTIRFKPYVSKVPWHTGPRGFLSQLFPRYGHYCGPNWSSGKDTGSLIWDKRPIDWLDFCCYCHDIGYDTYDQAELLKADLAFLECLEKPHMSTKGDQPSNCSYLQVYVHFRSKEYTDTLQTEPFELAVGKIFHSLGLAE